MRISDWNSDVCSSDLPSEALTGLPPFAYLNICGDIFCTDGDGQLEVTLGEGVYPVELIGRYVAAPSVLQVQGLESRRRELKASVKALRDLHETSGDRKSTRLNSSH